MKTYKLVLPFLMICLFFMACDDDVNFDASTDLNGTRSDIRSMLSSIDITQRASLETDNFRFVSEAGTIITAAPDAFVFQDGTPCTGTIDFELTELFTKSQILQYGIQTMTYDGEILESDGEFLFKASQNDQPLRLANGRNLDLLVPNSNPNSSMQLFSAIEGAWGLSPDIPVNIIELENPDSINDFFLGYETFSPDLDWVNIDYFTKFDTPLTDVSLCLPADYADQSVMTWVVFKDLDIVLQTDGRFLPIGEDIYVIVIAAEDEDTFRLDIQEVTVEEDLKVNLDPERTSIEDIKERLMELD